MGKEGDEDSLPVVKKDLCSVAQRSHSLVSFQETEHVALPLLPGSSPVR